VLVGQVSVLGMPEGDGRRPSESVGRLKTALYLR